jgi:hypothetical protein
MPVRSVITAEEAHAGASSQGRMQRAFQMSRHGAKPGRTGKRFVTRWGRAMMFTALWLTGARSELFPVMIWLAFGLLSAKQTSAAPSARLPIKLNLMPEFFHLLGRAKIR